MDGTSGRSAASLVDSSVASPDTAEVHQLRFDAAVPRQLVHKAAIEQVLLSDHQRIGEREFSCAAQLSRAHAYYSDHLLPLYDPLLLLEIALQAVVLGSHEYFGVRQGWQFIFSDIDGT